MSLTFLQCLNYPLNVDIRPDGEDLVELSYCLNQIVALGILRDVLLDVLANC